MKFENYQPDVDDIMWAGRIIAGIADNGILKFPMTRLVYRVSHKDRSLTLTNPEMIQDDEFTAVVHRRTIAVFSKLHYLVLVDETGSMNSKHDSGDPRD